MPKVLITDDEGSIRRTLKEILQFEKYEVDEAADGLECLAKLKQTAYDVILLDIKMPKMNGYNAAKIIKAIKPNLPIIAQSAYALENEIAEYINIFDDYLTKPIKSNDLKNVVQRYVELKLFNKCLLFKLLRFNP